MFITKKLAKQLFYISGIITLFLALAVSRCVTIGNTIPVMILILLALMIIACLSSAFMLFKDQNLLDVISKRRYEIILLASVLVLRIPLIQDMQRWDGGLYYSCIYDCVHDFSFSFDYLWNGMRFAGHPTIMFCFFSMLGEFITHGSPVGVGIVYTVMSAAAMVCLYRLFLRDDSEAGKASAVIFMLLIQCVPLFWGTVSYVNPDYMYLLLFIYFWYAHVNEEYVLCMFWMLSMFQTKELGIVIVAGYVAGHALSILLDKMALRDRVAALFKDYLIIIALINVVIMFVYYRFQGTLGSWEITTGESFKWFVSMNEIQARGTDVNAFGIYPKYMACKVLQLFVINFNWIATLGIIISCIKLKKDGEAIIRKHSISVAVSMFGFATFGVFFITFAILRYNVFFHVMLWYVCFTMVYRAFGKKLLARRVVCALIGILLCVQTFFYIDPLTNLVFLRVDSGKGKIVASEMRKRYFGDTLINNYRYSYIDGLLNELLTDIDYSGNTKIVCFDPLIDTSKIRYLDDGKEIGWNTRTHKRVLLQGDNNPDVCNIDTVDYDTIIAADTGLIDDQDELIIYFMKYIDVDEDATINELRTRYDVSDVRQLENWGGTLDYYVLKMY